MYICASILVTYMCMYVCITYLKHLYAILLKESNCFVYTEGENLSYVSSQWKHFLFGDVWYCLPEGLLCIQSS